MRKHVFEQLYDLEAVRADVVRLENKVQKKCFQAMHRDTIIIYHVAYRHT